MVNTEHCPLKYMYYTVYLTQKQIQSKYRAKYSASDKVRPSLGEAPAPVHTLGRYHGRCRQDLTHSI